MSAAWIDSILLVAAIAVTVFTVWSERRRGDKPTMMENLKVSSRMRAYPDRLLRQAGLAPHSSRLLFWSSKTVIALLMLPLASEASLRMQSAWITVPAVLSGFFSIDLWLLRRRKQRRETIERTLNYLLGLMHAYLRAGLNLNQAFFQSARHGLLDGNPLRAEAELIEREVAAGGERQQLFAALADRTGVNELRGLGALLTVSAKTGAPVVETLAAHTEINRARQWENASRLADRKSMQALLPISLVSLPIFAVLVLFPAVLQLLDALRLFRTVF